jgi:signal transduction histidine kinase
MAGLCLGALLLCGLFPGLYGVAIIAAMAGSVVVYLRFTRERQKELAALCKSLERIADGDYNVDLRACEEGEISILKDEIYKVTRSLEREARRLERDRVWLADTMADISHQLKTPLTSVAMMTELAASPDISPQKRRDFLEAARAGTERIRWLVTSMLKLSRLDADAVVFSRLPVPAGELIERAAAPLQILMEIKGIAFVREVEDFTVTGDPEWLTEAVGNILKNCVEHAKEGGTVTVRAGVNPLYRLVEISDDGPGISCEDLPHIFERFYRGKNASTDSAGIGLALSRGILLRHGGVIEAVSGAGKGTCFRIKLYDTAAIAD